jgi:hypothetical protein
MRTPPEISQAGARTTREHESYRKTKKEETCQFVDGCVFLGIRPDKRKSSSAEERKKETAL